jgi:hypothetical protein
VMKSCAGGCILVSDVACSGRNRMVLLLFRHLVEDNQFVQNQINVSLSLGGRATYQDPTGLYSELARNTRCIHEKSSGALVLVTQGGDHLVGM